MLVIASQHEGRRRNKPGRNPGISGGSEEMQFARDQAGLYAWTEKILVGQDYIGLKKAGKDLVRRYRAKLTERNRAKIARLIANL